MLIKPRFLRWVRLLAKGFGIVLFLFWGAFFLEHLREWFLNPTFRLAPLPVWLGQLAHLGLLLGLLLMVWLDRIGSVLVIISAALFFGIAAGHNFLLFFAVTAAPAALVLWSGWRINHAPACLID